jgi:hypothetical protein
VDGKGKCLGGAFDARGSVLQNGNSGHTQESMKPLWLSEDHTFSVINQTKKALITRSMNKGILSSLGFALSPLLALNPSTYD